MVGGGGERETHFGGQCKRSSRVWEQCVGERGRTYGGSGGESGQCGSERRCVCVYEAVRGMGGDGGVCQIDGGGRGGGI